MLEVHFHHCSSGHHECTMEIDVNGTVATVIDQLNKTWTKWVTTILI